MTRRLLFLALAAAACAPAPKPAAAPQDTAADARAVEQVLKDWYAASEGKDSVAYAAALHPDFFIFEDTTRIDGPTLVKLVAGSFAMGTDHAAMTDFNTKVSGDVAWTSFRNEEVFTPVGKGPTPPRRYLESVVFRRVGGKWLIERYHATRINRTADGM